MKSRVCPYPRLPPLLFSLLLFLKDESGRPRPLPPDGHVQDVAVIRIYLPSHLQVAPKGRQLAIRSAQDLVDAAGNVEGDDGALGAVWRSNDVAIPLLHVAADIANCVDDGGYSKLEYGPGGAYRRIRRRAGGRTAIEIGSEGFARVYPTRMVASREGGEKTPSCHARTGPALASEPSLLGVTPSLDSGYVSGSAMG